MPSPAVRRDATLDQRALESLEFIRTTMARSAAFTAVPGRGGVAMGLVAIAAAAVGGRTDSDQAWAITWLAAAAVAAPVGLVAMWWKARQYRISPWSAAGRRFAQGFVPALAAGAILTIPLIETGRFDLLPATWLLLYGAGVLAGSTSSVPVLAWLGVLIMAAGGGAAFTAGTWRDLWLGIGFGGRQVIFGIIIARKHGG